MWPDWPVVHYRSPICTFKCFPPPPPPHYFVQCLFHNNWTALLRLAFPLLQLFKVPFNQHSHYTANAVNWTAWAAWSQWSQCSSAACILLRYCAFMLHCFPLHQPLHYSITWLSFVLSPSFFFLFFMYTLKPHLPRRNITVLSPKSKQFPWQLLPAQKQTSAAYLKQSGISRQNTSTVLISFFSPATFGNVVDVGCSWSAWLLHVGIILIKH